LFAGGHTVEFGVDDGVGAALAQGDETDLGERAGGLFVTGAAERLVVSGVSGTSSTRPSMAITRSP
jgi:hypothetical protein